MSGVLDKKYAEERLKKRYLKLRYKQRALVSAWAIKKYLSLKGGFRLVDFGSADGLTIIRLADSVGIKGEYTGVEYDQSLIDSAPSLPPSIKLIRGDVTSLPMIENDYADVITALALLEHLDDPFLAIKEAKRILKPGGIIIATSPVPFWDHLADRILIKDLSGDEHHVTDMNRKMFLQLGRSSDLELVTFFYFMWAPIGFLPYLKIPVSEKFAWRIDRILNKLKLFNWSFVNQCIIFRKLN